MAPNTGLCRRPPHKSGATVPPLPGPPAPPSAAACTAVSQPGVQTESASPHSEQVVHARAARTAGFTRRGLRGARLERRAATRRRGDASAALSASRRSQLHGPRGRGAPALLGLPVGVAGVSAARRPQDGGRMEYGAPAQQPARPDTGIGLVSSREDWVPHLAARLYVMTLRGHRERYLSYDG